MPRGAALFIFGLKGMSSPASARRGIVIAGYGMLIAIAATFLIPGLKNLALMAVALAVGGAAAWISGQKVKMTDMPQMVAIYNGMGGGAAAAIAALEFARGEVHGPVVATLAVAAVNPIVAATIRRGAEVEDGLRGRDARRLSFSKDGLWLRQADPEGQTVIQAARANPDGTRLSQVRLHRFDSTGGLYARIEAEGAALGDRVWTLDKATRWDRTPDGRFDKTVDAAALDLPTALTREQILDSFSPPETVPFWELRRFIDQMEAAGFSARRHRLLKSAHAPRRHLPLLRDGNARSLRRVARRAGDSQAADRARRGRGRSC